MSSETDQALIRLKEKWPNMDHPILISLASRLEDGQWVTKHGTVEKFLIDRGRPFVGIARPSGYRGGSASAFENAYASAIGASDCRGVYVEGLTLHHREQKLRHHAWLTTDGVHAIERTWTTEATEFHYFGIIIPSLVFMHAIGHGIFAVS